MLIRVCFGDVLQPAVHQFVPGMIWLSASLYSKCFTVCTVNIYYLQLLAMHKKALSSTESIMYKNFYSVGGFPFDL